MEVIKKIRSWSNMPIIVISARNEDKDKIEALDAGADDYLTKPFSVDELLARLRAITRRISSMPNQTMAEASLFEMCIRDRFMQTLLVFCADRISGKGCGCGLHSVSGDIKGLLYSKGNGVCCKGDGTKACHKRSKNNVTEAGRHALHGNGEANTCLLYTSRKYPYKAGVLFPRRIPLPSPKDCLHFQRLK